MKRDWQTVTENRQIQQSVTFVFFFDGPTVGLAFSVALPLDSGVAGTPPSALSWFRALVLAYQLPVVLPGVGEQT